MKYLKTLLAAAMVLAVTFTTGEARADSNSEDRKSTRIAEVNPDLPEALLETLPSSILDEDIWVDPTLPPGTPFVEITPGGDLRAAPGQSAKQQREANELLSDKRLMARCTTGIVLPASVRNKRIESTCPAVIGWNNEATVTHSREALQRLLSLDLQGQRLHQEAGEHRTPSAEAPVHRQVH